MECHLKNELLKIFTGLLKDNLVLSLFLPSNFLGAKQQPTMHKYTHKQNTEPDPYTDLNDE